MAFVDAVVAGFKSLQLTVGLTVTVSRGAATTSVVAVPGDSMHTFSQDGQVTTETQSYDFLFLVSEYKIAGVVTLPQRNDKILSAGKTYSILSNSGEAYFRYSDIHRQIIRVHCKPS
jgi:FtsP/CotA-like multicopper oxidase with cupredoxin domain